MVYKKVKKKRNSALFIFVFLGLLTAFGPVVTDMYLPALPSMTGFFQTSVPMVQMGLTFSMLGLAVGQLLFGPLSDKFGRRRPLIVSMVLFIIATGACIFAPSIEFFVAMRFIQGIAASGGIVIARSIAADKFKKQNLAKALAIVGAINGIAPIAAPVIGGMVVGGIGWQGIFVVLLIMGLALLGFGYVFRESLSRPRRLPGKITQTVKSFKQVFRNQKYVFYTLELSFALAILFAYIASSPFLIQNHYGFSPFVFSLIFAANAVAIGVGAAAAAHLPVDKGLKISVVGINICAVGVLAVLTLNGPFAVFEGLLFLLSLSLGVSFTIATAVAMESARAQAGTASAVMGAGGFLFGSVVSPIVGLGNIMISTGVVLVVCAALATVCAVKGLQLSHPR